MSAPPPRQPGPDAPTSISIGPGARRSRARRVTRQTRPKGPAPHSPRTLRLTDSPPPLRKQAPKPTPLTGGSDPRWVLAVRTAELLQGDILTPECRERIVRMGKMFNLTPFDANMIIAIVQDQARRGIEPHLCPTAGEPQLRMITPPKRRSVLEMLRTRYGLTLLALITIILTLETLLILWLRR